MVRIAAVVVALVIAAAPARADSPSTGAAQAAHLASRAHDRAIRADVLGWHHTMSNGCVAYASTALRHVGVEIPVDGKIDGQGVSRITRSFSRYLVEELGWTRVESIDELRVGDMLFSTDAPCCPGYPNHVSMFDGWSQRRKKIALVVDNQGFHIARPLVHSTGSDVDGFAYALRPPESKDLPKPASRPH